MNPLNADPTRTIMLRRRFESEFRKRFNLLKQRINQAFTQPRYVLEDAHYVDQFSQWLTTQTQQIFLSDEWWEKFIEEAYRKGAGRAWDESEGIDPTPERSRFVSRVLRNQRIPILNSEIRCTSCEGTGCSWCGGPEADYHTMCGGCPTCDNTGRLTTNVFCPTGQGGGVDPSCSPPQSYGASPSHYEKQKLVEYTKSGYEQGEAQEAAKVHSRFMEAEIMGWGRVAVSERPDYVAYAAQVKEGKKWKTIHGFKDRSNDVAVSDYDRRMVDLRKRVVDAVPAHLWEPTENAAVSTERVKFLAQRLKGEIKGATDAMAQSIARSLSDGLMKGKSPIEIAKAIRRNVDGIGLARSRLIARTEVVRAHAEGTLDAMEDLGFSTGTIAVEWDTTSKQPCPMCKALDGVVFSLKEMRGLIPRHPNCLCRPKIVLGATKGLRKSESAVRAAVKKSKRLDTGTRWNAPSISKKRPRVIKNVFCPTGPGGGIDPTCSPGGSGPMPSVGDEVRIRGSKYWAEPFDGDDTFPPAIASYEIVDGHIFYTGRNGSEGVVTGSRKDAEKWMKDVRDEVQRRPPDDAIARQWTKEDGGEENVRRAKEMVSKTSSAFGIAEPQVEATVVKRPLESGSHGVSKLTLSNPHLSTPNSDLSFKGTVSRELHVAAHETVHSVYSTNPDLGKKYVDRLRDSGEYVSVYHSLGGHFEGLMELGAAYVHSPNELKKYSPELFSIADSWAKEMRGR